MKTIVLAAAMLGSLSGAAFAQTTTTPAPAATVPMAATVPAASSDMTGLRMASTATLAVKFMTVKPADMMSSKLIGVNLYNNQNESLGEIDDLVIDNGKTITGIVAGVGGFLGMGESYVVLDPSTVVLNQKDGTLRAYVDTNKDTLKNAPKFQYSKKKA